METFVSVLCTVIITFATVALALLTRKYVELTKAMLDDIRNAREPDVFVDFEIPGHTTRFVIGNAGECSARNIRFDVLSDASCFERSHEQSPGKLADLRAIQKGISFLSPGRTLKFKLGALRRHFDSDGPCIMRILVRFENAAGKGFVRDIVIDMTQYSGVLFESFQDSGKVIADAVGDLRRWQQRQVRSSRALTPFHQRPLCPTCAEPVSSAAQKCPHCHVLIPKPQDA